MRRPPASFCFACSAVKARPWSFCISVSVAFQLLPHLLFHRAHALVDRLRDLLLQGNAVDRQLALDDFSDRFQAGSFPSVWGSPFLASRGSGSPRSRYSPQGISARSSITCRLAETRAVAGVSVPRSPQRRSPSRPPISPEGAKWAGRRVVRQTGSCARMAARSAPCGGSGQGFAPQFSPLGRLRCLDAGGGTLST